MATSPSEDDVRWLVINGRRWRRTDPSLPMHVVDVLKSHLGHGRSAVRIARASRAEPEPDRLAPAEAALKELDALR